MKLIPTLLAHLLTIKFICMKRILFSTFLLFFLVIQSNQLQAQLGVRASLNLANATLDPDSAESTDFSSKLGLGIGVFYKLILSDQLTLQPELNYMQQGTKLSGDILGESFESTFSLNYLQIPVLFKYSFGDMNATNFFVEAGPYIGIGIGKEKIESCYGGKCETIENDYDGEDVEGPKPLDYGLQVGVGVNLNKNISVDARYLLGLSNLNGDSEGSFKNKAINIGVGYSF